MIPYVPDRRHESINSVLESELRHVTWSIVQVRGDLLSSMTSLQTPDCNVYTTSSLLPGEYALFQRVRNVLIEISGVVSGEAWVGIYTTPPLQGYKLLSQSRSSPGGLLVVIPTT